MILFCLKIVSSKTLLEIKMIVTILVNPMNFKMKMKFLKGKFNNIEKVVADLVPVSETFNGKFLEYTYEISEEQFENMK